MSVRDQDWLAKNTPALVILELNKELRPCPPPPLCLLLTDVNIYCRIFILECTIRLRMDLKIDFALCFNGGGIIISQREAAGTSYFSCYCFFFCVLSCYACRLIVTINLALKGTTVAEHCNRAILRQHLWKQKMSREVPDRWEPL